MQKRTLFIEFDADFPTADADWERIHNADYLANEFSTHLESKGIRVIESDLWKDFGWYLVCESDGARLDVLFARYSAEEAEQEGWQLTVEPSSFPRLISRLLGKKPVPYHRGLQKLASSLHEVLAGSPSVRNLRYTLSTNVKREADNPTNLDWQN